MLCVMEILKFSVLLALLENVEQVVCEMNRLIQATLQKAPIERKKAWIAYVHFALLKGYIHVNCSSTQMWLKHLLPYPKELLQRTSVKSNGQCQFCCKRYECQRLCYEDSVLDRTCEHSYDRVQNNHWKQCEIREGKCLNNIQSKSIVRSLFEKQAVIPSSLLKPILNKCKSKCQKYVCEGNCFHKLDYQDARLTVTYPVGNITFENLKKYVPGFLYGYYYTWKFHTDYLLRINITFVQLHFLKRREPCNTDITALHIEQDVELNHINCYTSPCGRPFRIERATRYKDKQGSLRSGVLNKKRRVSKFCGSHARLSWFSSSNDVEIYAGEQLGYGYTHNKFSIILVYQVLSVGMVQNKEPQLPTETLFLYHLLHGSTSLAIYKIQVLKYEQLCFSLSTIEGELITLHSGPSILANREDIRFSSLVQCVASFQGIVTMRIDKIRSEALTLVYAGESLKSHKLSVNTSTSYDPYSFCQNNSMCVLNLVGNVFLSLGVEVTDFEQVGPPSILCDSAGVTVFDSSSDIMLELITLCKRFDNVLTPAADNHSVSIFSAMNSLVIVLYKFAEVMFVNFTLVAFFSGCSVVQLNPCLEEMTLEETQSFLTLAPYERLIFNFSKYSHCYTIQITSVGGNANSCKDERKYSVAILLRFVLEKMVGTMQCKMEGFVHPHPNQYNLIPLTMRHGFTFERNHTEGGELRKSQLPYHQSRNLVEHRLEHNMTQTLSFLIQTEYKLPYRDERQPMIAFASEVPAFNWFQLHFEVRYQKIDFGWSTVRFVDNKWSILEHVAYFRGKSALLLTPNPNNTVEKKEVKYFQNLAPGIPVVFKFTYLWKYQMHSDCAFCFARVVAQHLRPHVSVALVLWNQEVSEAKIKATETDVESFLLQVSFVANTEDSFPQLIRKEQSIFHQPIFKGYEGIHHVYKIPNSNSSYWFSRYEDASCCGSFTSCKSPTWQWNKTSREPLAYCFTAPCQDKLFSWREAIRFCMTNFTSSLPIFFNKYEQDSLLKIVPNAVRPIEAIFIGLAQNPDGKVSVLSFSV